VTIIEQHIMERNPNVKWDDIAELREVSLHPPSPMS
jgi:uncharacterized protein with HEPN domain